MKRVVVLALALVASIAIVHWDAPTDAAPPSGVTAIPSANPVNGGDTFQIDVAGWAPNEMIFIAIADPGCCLHTSTVADSNGDATISWTANTSPNLFVITFEFAERRPNGKLRVLATTAVTVLP